MLAFHRNFFEISVTASFVAFGFAELTLTSLRTAFLASAILAFFEKFNLNHNILWLEKNYTPKYASSMTSNHLALT